MGGNGRNGAGRAARTAARPPSGGPAPDNPPPDNPPTDSPPTDSAPPSSAPPDRPPADTDPPGRPPTGSAPEAASADEAEPLLPTELPPTAPDAAGTPEPVPPEGTAGSGGQEPEEPRRRWRPPLPSPRDLVVYALYAVGALYVLQHLVGDPGGRVQLNVPDQTLFEWVLGFGSRVVTDQLFPFVTNRLNFPVGVNMMANTSVLGVSLPLTPVTVLFGTAVGYVVFSALGLAGTAAAWYYVLSRHVVRSRAAAAIGGGLAGFSPAMISHSYGHPNIAAQFLVPFIVWRSIKLREPHRWLRNGIALALLVIWQAFINEEVLLVTAVGLLIFTVSYVLMRPTAVVRHGLPFVAGALTAAVIAGAALAYPLHVQFNGHQHGLPATNSSGPRPYAADLLAFPGFSHDSLAGHHTTLKLAQNVAEQSAFFGWPLLLLLLISLVLMAHSRVFWSATIVAVILASLSLGGRINVDGRETKVPGTWTLIGDLPLFRQVVPTRFAVAVAPVLAVMLALAFDRVLALTARNPFSPFRLLWIGLTIAALVPIVPVPIGVRDRPPVPGFIASGTWRRYVDDRHSLVGIPSASVGNLEAMRWAAISRVGFAIPGGYYLGPDGAFGAPPRPTSTLLDSVAATGHVPTVTGKQISDATADLRFWRAAVVVIVPGSQTEAVKHTVTNLLDSEPSLVDGVWLWDVRGKVDQ
jgi:hypothetical protein